MYLDDITRHTNLKKKALQAKLKSGKIHGDKMDGHSWLGTVYRQWTIPRISYYIENVFKIVKGNLRIRKKK